MGRKRRGGRAPLAARVFAWALGGLFAGLGAGAQRLLPVPPPGGAPPTVGKPGLHIRPGKHVNFTWTTNDGAGYRWDIQHYGTVGQGTGGAYSGGMYLRISGSSVRSSGRGWLNAAGDEVEIGPYSRGTVRIYRRIKIYRDRGLARWVDIFENPASRDITLTVQLFSDMITTVGQTVSSSGKNQFTNQDHAFVTVCQRGGTPALMHYVCSPRSKLRPTVTVRGDNIYVNYRITVPAGKAVALCYFESQNRSAGALRKLMKDFRPSRAVRDLSPTLRRLLLNMPVGRGIGGVDLERSATRDLVHNRHGDPIFGTIANDSFRLETLFGAMTLPADEVIGMASAEGQEGQFRVLLAGGQVLAGRMAKGARLELELPAGGVLRVPFADLRQCAYRISKQRPEESEFAGPLLILRTGDRVAFEPGSVDLTFRTRHGVVALTPEDLLEVTLDHVGNGVHRATFLNGSQLAGLLEPEQVPLTLKLGPKLTLSRNLVAKVRFAAEEKPDATLDAVVLSNGDELFGRFAEEELTLTTRYGKVKLQPESVQAMSFSRTHLGRVGMRLWNGSVLRGQFDRAALAFQVTPGPTLDIHVGHYVRVRRSQALPPEKIRQTVRALVRQLGAEGYKERQEATEKLIKMGRGIIPMLRKHLPAGDPEVRQRIDDILERLGGAPAGLPAGPRRSSVQILHN